MLRCTELYILCRNSVTFFKLDVISESLKACNVLQLTRSGCSLTLGAVTPILQP